MKIFNWVHRKFNNKENPKKNGDIAGYDKQFLDENKCNVFECWGGGILTIGTFGYDPLKDESEQTNGVCNFLYEEDEELDMEVSLDYQSHDEISDTEEEEVENAGYDYEQEEEDEEEEESPLVFGAYEEDLEDLMDEKKREEFGFEYVMIEKKARTTLADLFNADSDQDMKKKPALEKGEFIKDKSNYSKPRVSLRKKLKLEEARPIHKLHQLMRRMMKRKIHPEIGPLNSKVSVKKRDTNDHALLLQTSDAII